MVMPLRVKVLLVLSKRYDVEHLQKKTHRDYGKVECIGVLHHFRIKTPFPRELVSLGIAIDLKPIRRSTESKK